MATIAIPIHTETLSSPRSIYNRNKLASRTSSASTPTTPSTLTIAAPSTPTKRTSGLSLDFVMGKQQARDHDSSTIADQLTILHTPRRGRRVGRVDLGWESPIAGTHSVTPRKRRAEHEDQPPSSLSQSIRLVDSQGVASAAVLRVGDGSLDMEAQEEAGAAAGMQSEAIQTPSQPTQQGSPSKLRKYDKLAGFQVKGDDSTPSALIAIEVPTMGRMAVHRTEAGQIARIDAASLAFDSSSSSGGCSTSVTSTSTKLTSVDTPCPTDPSPSFSLSSHFPASLPSSPSKGRGHLHLDLSAFLHSASTGQTIQEKIQALREAHRSDYNRPSTGEERTDCTPRLAGAKMATLDWPDSPDGPWSSAGKQVHRLWEQKQRGIARWLDDSSEDEREGPGMASRQQHPMVAKAIHDRARKEMLIRSFSMPHLQAAKRISPTKKSRRTKAKRESGRLRWEGGAATGSKSVYLHPPTSLNSSAAFPEMSSVVGCACGSVNETSSMVQCDACNLWFHFGCVGIASNDDCVDEWYCQECCNMAASVLSPSSLGGDRASLITTPSFPRSAAIAGQQLRQSQGQLPVFAHPPTDSPLQREELRHAHQAQQALPPGIFSSALALAPSPVMSSSHNIARMGGSAVRHRASRIGWHQAEPGSPLERKSGSGGSALHRRNLSGSGTVNGNSLFPAFSPGRRRVPTYEQAALCSDFAVPPRTPSPRFMATPSRTRSSNLSLRGHDRRESSIKDLDDIFSTPSRILQGSATWGAHHWHQTPNHSTSMLRHSREDSGLAAANLSAANATPWGLSTPTRFMDSGSFSSDHSGANGGLPSLVFSSGGAGFDVSDLTWQLQSPSSSTRAATRARQNSSNRRVMTSSVRDRTPTQQGSIEQQSCPSSSPFPKTPTFSDLLHQHHQSPPMSSSKKLNRLSHQQQLSPTLNDPHPHHHQHRNHNHGLHMAAELNCVSESAGNGRRLATSGTKANQAAAAAQVARARNVSSGELMAGLGIGLDLEDGEWKASTAQLRASADHVFPPPYSP